MPTDITHPRHPDNQTSHRPMTSSAIPPSDPAPYRAARRKSQASRVLVLGGVGIMAAAVTAAGILAARKLADAVSGDERGGAISGRDRYGPRPLAPRFAELDEEEREEIRRRDRERAMRERNRIARTRAIAARERVAPRRNVARDLADTATDLSGSLNGVVGSLTSAMIGFRQVAEQAGGIMREFSAAADTVRGFLDQPGTRRYDERQARRDAETSDHDRTHRL